MSADYKRIDREYEDRPVTSVEPSKGGWSIGTDAYSFFVPDHGVEPHVDDTARFYGRGFGSVVRGLDLNGVEVFYRTPEEQARKDAADRAAYLADKQRRFEANKADLDAQYDALPPAFKARIDRFRENRDDFRWQHEAYELSVCTDAALIAWTLKTPEAIAAFHDLPWEQQQEMVPGLFDGHSGNSFGAACYLARLYIEQPDLVDKAHGALCPLVGCQEYGCYASEFSPDDDDPSAPPSGAAGGVVAASHPADPPAAGTAVPASPPLPRTAPAGVPPAPAGVGPTEPAYEGVA